MRKITFLLAALVLLTATPAYAVWIWTPQTKKWINPKYAVKDTPQEQLAFAESFYEQKDYDRVIKEAKKLIKYFPNSKEAAQAQFYVGLGHENLGYLYEAHQAYQKVVDEYPHAKNFDEVVERQYNIGERLLAGERIKYFGVKLFPSFEKAAEIFEKVSANAPYGRYGAQAQYKAGEAYIKAGLYPEATGAFLKVVETYPGTEWGAKANYELASTSLKASLKPAYDQESTDKAIGQFEEFVNKYPESQSKGPAEEALKNLKERRAEAEFSTAEFYEKQKKLESAEIYYRSIMNDYPDTSWAQKARGKVNEIRGALGEPLLEEQAEEPALPEGEATEETEEEIQEDEQGTLPQGSNAEPCRVLDVASDTSGNVKILLSAPVKFTHYKAKDSTDIIIDLLEPAFASGDAEITLKEAKVKAVKLVKGPDFLPDGMDANFYSVDFVVLKLDGDKLYEVTQEGSEITVNII